MEGLGPPGKHLSQGVAVEAACIAVFKTLRSAAFPVFSKHESCS